MAFGTVTAGLLLLTTFLHFWRIGDLPPGFYIDESSTSYNAWCIAKTGSDENGNAHPIFFPFEGQYQDPVLIYSQALLVKFFGLRKSVVRVPSAIFSILAAVMFALLTYEYCRNRWLSALGGWLFSISPWVFPVSRTASGAYTSMLLGVVAGWLFALRGLRKSSSIYGVGSGVAWALVAYSYHAGRPVALLLLAAMMIAFRGTVISSWRVWLALWSSFAVCLAPMMARFISAPEVLTARFEATSILHGNPASLEIVGRFASRYLDYFCPRFLFLAGDSNLRHHTGCGGEMFAFLVPVMIVGLWHATRMVRRAPPYRFLVFGLLCYPAVAALTYDRMHSMRSVNGLPFLLLVAMVGAQHIWKLSGLGRRAVYIVACIGVVEIAFYFHDYFGAYQVRCRNEFNASFVEALEDCFANMKDDDTLYISGTAFAPLQRVVTQEFRPYYYTDILFFGKIDPQLYQSNGVPRDKVSPYTGAPDRPGLLLRCNVQYMKSAMEGAPPFEFSDEPIPSGAQLLLVKPAEPPVRYEIYRLKQP